MSSQAAIARLTGAIADLVSAISLLQERVAKVEQYTGVAQRNELARLLAQRENAQFMTVQQKLDECLAGLREAIQDNDGA